MNLHDLDTPALLVDSERLERNLAQMAEQILPHGKALRPHAKTHKTPEIARLQIAAGAVGLTVAKLGEAEAFAEAGLTDFFVANQIVGAAKTERLLALARRADVLVGVDSLAAALPLSDAAHRAGQRIRVRIEVDSGLHRAGLRSTAEVVAFAAQIVALPGLTLEGFFTHEGHVYRTDTAHRAEACAAVGQTVREVADALRQAGLPCETVSVGSSPSAEYMVQEAGVTEVRPGVYVFSDQMQTDLGAPPDACALTVLATVVSRPDATTAIVDAGTKSLASDRSAAPETRYRHGRLLDAPDVSFDWASEEHGHLNLAESAFRPAVGERVRVVPYHACTCVNLHESLYVVRGEEVLAEWRIAARGRIR